LGELRIRDLDTFLISLLYQASPDFQASGCSGCSNVVEDSFVTIQWFSHPVLADLAEKSMLDWIPLGCAGRIVADRDGDVPNSVELS
jgi:hypothetical protein